MSEAGTSGYDASLDQTLNLLKAMALSPAYQTEVIAYKTALAAEPININITDANGSLVTVALLPSDPSDMSYIADAFGAVYISQQEKLLEPFPVLELVGMPGREQNAAAAGERFTNDVVEGEVYSIDAYTWSSGEDAKHTQLEALTLAYCFKSLVRRNEHLGGMVRLIQPQGPVQAMGGGKYEGTLVEGSLTRFDVYVNLP